MSGRRILIADDDTTTRYILERIIRKCDPGVNIESFSSGEALVARALQEQNYDLIFTDCEMEERCSGIDVIKEIKKHYPHKPVYMVSASTQMKEKALEEGASGFIEKTIDIDHMRKEIERRIKHYPDS